MQQIVAERLIQRLNELARIGATRDGGVDRIAFSDTDVEARKVVAARMLEAGLRVRSDAIGNTIGRPEGDPTAPAIVLGSHTDTVPNGGRYDGALGVIAAIECARTLIEHGALPGPIEVVNFVNEEQGLLGSRAWAGQVASDEIASPEMRMAIHELGGRPDELHTARRDPATIRAYLELHVEQGPRLEQDAIHIGAVTGIVGMKRLTAALTGEAAHAGATPMERRRDALVAASKLTVAVNDIARALTGKQVATVGSLHVSPNASNVVPGHVEMTIDLRDIEVDTIRNLEQRIRREAQNIAGASRVEIEFVERDFLPPARSADWLIERIERAATDLGLTTSRLESHAGHDASIIGQIAPVAMIFVPSVDGISHSPREFTRDEDCVNGANVLLNAVRVLAGCT